MKKSQKGVDTNRHIWYYKVVESDKSCRILLKGGETMKKVIHAEYVFIPAYQKRKKLTDENMSQKLGMSIRTYRDKVKGYGDFTLTEANKICELLEETKDNLFC